MKTITTEWGTTYVLMPPSYAEKVLATPLGIISRLVMTCQIHNCGYIVCFPEKNKYFNVYEPTDNEYELEGVYQALEKENSNKH